MVVTAQRAHATCTFSDPHAHGTPRRASLGIWLALSFAVTATGCGGLWSSSAGGLFSAKDAERAKLLGYPNFAAYSLADQMAKWLVSAKGQQVIADYKLHGKQLFFGDAK